MTKDQQRLLGDLLASGRRDAEKIIRLEKALGDLLRLSEAVWVGEGGSSTAFDAQPEVKAARDLLTAPPPGSAPGASAAPAAG